MKKHLLVSIALVGCCVSAFGQGQIFFANSDESSVPGITINGQPTGSGLQVSLFWFNGTSYVDVKDFTSTYTGNGTALNGPGYFNAGVVNIAGSGLQIFKVTVTANISFGLYLTGTTPPFAAQVNALPTPALYIDQGPPSGTQAGGWNGHLELTVPEPATIALGGLGAAALLLFRRRK